MDENRANCMFSRQRSFKNRMWWPSRQKVCPPEIETLNPSKAVCIANELVNVH